MTGYFTTGYYHYRLDAWTRMTGFLTTGHPRLDHFIQAWYINLNTINTAALRMHMQPHMLESLLAEWPQPILRIFNIQHGEAWLLHLIGASSDESLTIRHDPDYILRHNLVD